MEVRQAPSTLSTYTNKTLTYQFEVVDSDGDPVTLSMLNPSAEAQLTSSGKLTFNSNKVSTYRFTVVASDGKASTNFDVVINVEYPTGYKEFEYTETSSLKAYPNPFAGISTIEFALSKRQFVKLCVFNSLGQQVSVIANSEFEAGIHQLGFNGKGLPEGIYMGKMQTPGGIKTIKLVKSSGLN